MRILLIRHGQDQRGYRGGWSQRGLNEQGMNQSHTLADHLQTSWQPVDYLLASDLRRAMQTAEAISQSLHLPVHETPQWREMNNGELAGMLHEEACERYPGLFAHTLEMDEPYPGGESPRQFFQRISQAFEELCRAQLSCHLPPNIAIVTHGGPINIVYALLKHIEWSNKMPSFPMAATSIHEIVFQDGRWQISVENSNCHLEINPL
ncbi:histidine phosphatase family protein [Tengunoibacter tsumagoiensis]|uniref:Phosphoglycerate mutase n=1 Tax=Tengunoibacter tsumagoiensis TaxID=2014871 RepID=A0A402A5Z1_9CHLR|nr:histidine phosphatase family protein [Tengunoibacter tsumagoiensis]GCE14558.1 phosphoglycerate mutase [Tengunoibacter tsumagoiensis]